MNFKELYTDSKTRIAETILGMWKENAPKMVETYGEELKDIIEKSISDNIVVENMSRWEASEGEDWKNIINTNIWRKKDEKGNIIDQRYSPYKHQYESWKTLLKDNKSIVVTSGTGSGKTECFMVPLIHDLTKNQIKGQGRTWAVEAIFLYPLNALMEDQKERIDNYITFSDKELKFAVYNGNTPENEKSPKYSDDSAYRNEIITRQDIRREKPNILFTNPSMLEYMLLRKKDSGLFSDKLKWIVIDETHTYKGSAGAELAMLIRRVLKACGVNANDIKFATSSATIGSGDEASKRELKEFISQITGQSVDKIEVIEGHRTDPVVNEEVKTKLKNNDFILLKDLIPGTQTIEQKLETINGWADNGLRVRLHYYLQTLNFGLYVDPRNANGKKFDLSRTIPLVDGKLDTHYLDAYYCKECGALLGYGEKLEDGRYSRRIREEVVSLDEDWSADNTEDQDGDSDTNLFEQKKSSELQDFYLGLSCCNTQNNPNKNQWALCDNDNKIESAQDGIFKYKSCEMHKDKKVHYCPCCGAHGDEGHKPVQSFHLSADFISRLIAPILLDQTSDAVGDNLPRNGRKYIAFADSRQSAAGPTLKQNLETEEIWVAGVLIDKLNRNKDEVERAIRKSTKNIDSWENDDDYTEDDIQKEKYKLRKNENKKANGYYITWNEALDALKNDKNFERMFLAFVKPDDDDSKESKNKYALSALTRVLSRKPAFGANCPENWGLICTHYPALDDLKNRELDNAIIEFNKLIQDGRWKITPKDWYDYVKIFVDYNIRRNERFYFDRRNDDDWDKIDYASTRLYKTKLGSRRPIDDNDKNRIQFGNNLHTKLLISLLEKDLDEPLSLKDIKDGQKDCIIALINLLRQDLENYQIKRVGQEINWEYDKKTKKYIINGWRNSKNNICYMNLTDIAFRLYDENVWFDSNLRIPLSTTFKGISPEKNKETNKYDVICNPLTWTPLCKEACNRIGFEERRAEIKHKWTSKLERILEYVSKDSNTLYIQAEHTAEVARSIIKEKTEKFKKGELNIMACSTTMEMGVDLGDLELVVMNNVPPHPANYKQRAGRAGRGDQNKSAAVTICGCDASGEALMRNPLQSLICAPIESPRVVLRDSKQLVQRHVNSFLFRKFITDENVNFSPGTDTENDQGVKVFYFFTSYFQISSQPINDKWIPRVYIDMDSPIWPSKYTSLLENNNSYYSKFIAWLDKYSSDSNIIDEIKNLTREAFDKNVSPVDLINKTKETIQKIAEQLNEELLSIQQQWDDSNCNPGQNGPWIRLNYRFTSILQKNLLSYLSTHQFTPNANMPIDLVEMLVNDEDSYSSKENPTRDMRIALSEYAPGRRVFVNDVTYLMGGVEWNHNYSNRKLKKCSNNHTWLDGVTCPICNNQPVCWGDGFGDSIEIITPTGFYPYKDTTRITQKESLDLVLDTALIGAGSWMTPTEDNYLYAIRTNENQVDSKILYYNRGLGSGYYVCKECGYAVPVPQNASNDTETIKKALYPIENEGKRAGFYHNYRGWKCECKTDDNIDEKVFKNVVFGGAIQTDYCEIALYEREGEYMQYSDDNKQIATTLGLLLCREFANLLGCNQNELDFIVRQQDNKMSICIFDTAKGGAGYSKRLATKYSISQMFDSIRKKLDECVTIDKILDRTTMQYANRINVKATKEWLAKEYECRKVVPQEIQNRFSGNVIVAYYEEIKRELENKGGTLFFNGERIDSNWNYNEGDVNWHNNRRISFGNTNIQTFVVYNIPTIITPYDKCKLLLSGGQSWKQCNNPLGDFYPIAKVGDVLYFTTEEQCSVLNAEWGARKVYSVNYDEFELSDYVLIIDEQCMIEQDTQINTKGLFTYLYDKSQSLQNFIEAVEGHSLSFTYHEEYLRTHLGMTITLQFILEFAKKANAEIANINIRGEVYDDSRWDNGRGNYDDCGAPCKLWVNCLNSGKRDEYIEEKFLISLKKCSKIKNYSVESLQRGELPHWRNLIIKDENTGDVINILPNGGFANGWSFDNGNAVCTYYPSNCNIDTEIPIESEERIMYDIKIGEL